MEGKKSKALKVRHRRVEGQHRNKLIFLYKNVWGRNFKHLCARVLDAIKLHSGLMY